MLKNLYRKIADNFTEIWLGILLFIGLPLAAGIYLDWRAFFATTVVFQSIILILFVYKDK